MVVALDLFTEALVAVPCSLRILSKHMDLKSWSYDAHASQRLPQLQAWFNPFLLVR